MDIELARYLSVRWQAAKEAKSPIQRELMSCLRAVRGEYEEDVLARIKEQGGSEVFIRLTDVKCRAATSWLSDALMPAGEKPWAVEPTPLPDLPPEVHDQIAQFVVADNQEEIAAAQQVGLPINQAALRDQAEKIKKEMKANLSAMAKEAAEEVSKIIEDQMTEGGFYDALAEFLNNLVIFKTAFFKGPVTRMRPRLSWGPDGEPVVNETLVVEYESPSPFDVYPSPGARTLQDEYYFERHLWERDALVKLLGVEGFDEAAIRVILSEEHGRPMGFETADSERSKLEDRANDWQSPDDRLEVLEFHGKVPGRDLIDWGADIPDPDIDYEAECWICSDVVFSARVNNHPLGHRPMYGTSCVITPGSIWGKGIPEIMGDIQSICNSSVRALINNLAIASGPQVWVNQNRMPAGMDITSLFPWKIWPFNESVMGESGAPMGFFQPDAHISELLKVFEYFSRQASEITGVPAYVYGSDNASGGAGRTASGLSMLMNAATKGLKAITRNVDMNVISKVVYDHWIYVMMYHEGDVPRGDINIRARASDALIQAEQIQIRLLEISNSTNNQTDLQIMGMDGRAELLRRLLKSAKIDSAGVIPERGDINLNDAEVRMANGMKNLSVALNIPVDQLAAIAGGVAQQEGGQQQQQQAPPRQLLPGGMPAGGGDMRQ